MIEIPEFDIKMATFREWVETLDWKQRQEVISEIKDFMCMYCGGEPRCHCWNDE